MRSDNGLVWAAGAVSLLAAASAASSRVGSAGGKVYVYANQYGSWWGLTRPEWEAVVREGLRGEGRELPYARMLAGRPKAIRGVQEGRVGSRGLWATNDARVKFPLDWTVDDWAWEWEHELNLGAPPQGSAGRISSVSKIDHYPWMKLRDTDAFVALTRKTETSAVARSPRGFYPAFEKAEGAPSKMGRTHRDTPGRGDSYMWWERRNEFISRHMGQVEKNQEKLWKPNGDPTKRHLGLIAWAYTPDPDGVDDWLSRNAR